TNDGRRTPTTLLSSITICFGRRGPIRYQIDRPDRRLARSRLTHLRRRGVDLAEDPRHPSPCIRIHRQEVDDVRPVLAVLVAVAAGRAPRSRRAGTPSARRASPLGGLPDAPLNRPRRTGRWAPAP